ncbi:MAG: PorP/SprF family type IX secretion system membrane protein, partial [Lentimicrobiaceae bacterium]
MKAIRTITLIILTILFVQTGFSQDPMFSQFYNVPTYYNPATVGLSPGLKARLSVRDQWTQLPGELRDYSFSLDFAERDIPGSGGLGLIVMNDNAGTGYFQTSMVGLSTSVRINVQENMVSQVGIMTSFVQKSINWDNLVFTDQLDPIYGNIYETNFQNP